MNLYFDTEFTGLVPNTTLISLGIVAETGEKFYAEFSDFNELLVTPWIEENVLQNLWLLPNDKSTAFQFDKENLLWYHKGNTEQMRDALLIWLDHVRKDGDRIQFVSDVCHYDFYLLQNQVFGGAFKMPDYINPVCYDICQDICEWVYMGVGNNFNRTENMHNAFDVSREELVETFTEGKGIPSGKKHNALYDAEIIKSLYEFFYNRAYGTKK